MRRPLTCAALLGLAMATALAGAPSRTTRPDAPAGRPAAHDVLASLPVSFEPAADRSFLSRGPGYSLAVTPAGAVLGVRGGAFGLRPAGPGANPAAPLVGAQPLGGTVTRLTGDDPARWRAGLPAYGRVEARQVWPGVDMVWHGDRRRLEHDMVVAPGVDPSVVALDVVGAQSLTVDAGGDLVLDLGGATARLARPVVYQDVAGGRREVAGEFSLLGPSRIGFRLGAYDRARPLVIDPTLVTSTFLGGSGNDGGYALALDGQGNVYVTGGTESADFPTGTPLQAALSNAGGGPTSDVFVSKLTPDGSRLVWSTYLGGRARDTGYSLAVGGDGTVYVSGVTESPDFPRARAAQDRYGGGPSDAFVARITPDGTALEWSTFVGGAQADRARGVAVDRAGNAYVTGSTNSVDFPAVNPHNPGPFRAEDLDAFLVKIPAAGTPLTFATRLGGSNDDRGLAVAVDGDGNPYVTGDTLSPGFPTVRPLQPASGGSAGGVAGSFPDAFVSKFNPAGSALVYSTFLGGSDFDQGTSIAVDAQGAAYVAGNTNSPNFPTVAPLQPRKDSDADAFVAKVDPPGAALVYSTYVGGTGADGANGISVDQAGNAHVVGTTGSANWPTTRAVQGAKGGADDAFVLELDATGAKALFSTFLGGREADAGMDVAVDAQGGAHVLGLTSSTDFPSVKPVQGSRPAAGGDAFVATLDLTEASPSPATTAVAPPGPAASASSGHDRRVRILGGLTLALLLAAVLQTVYLRRRAPAGSGAAARPAPTPARKPSASPGLKVLESSGAGGTKGKKKASAKSGSASSSTRTPKARGGPKGQKPDNARKPATAKAGLPEEALDDGGPPTALATPVPPPAKVKPQEPGIAQLLEEDLWAPEPPPQPPEPPPEAPETAEAPPQVQRLNDGGEQPGRGREHEAEAEAPAAPSPPAPAIPPVPAEELSFWDLFPEDLPPARPVTVPVEDLLADPLSLPEGPDSVAGRVVPAEEPDRPAGDDEPPQPAPSRPRPPEAEIVIAELLDGPLPTGLRPSAESPWGPQAPGDDLLISDLLANQPQPPGHDEDRTAAAGPGRDKDDQARIAADQARRRRRARGSGRRKKRGSG